MVAVPEQGVSWRVQWLKILRPILQPHPRPHHPVLAGYLPPCACKFHRSCPCPYRPRHSPSDTEHRHHRRPSGGPAAVQAGCPLNRAGRLRDHVALSMPLLQSGLRCSLCSTLDLLRGAFVHCVHATHAALWREHLPSLAHALESRLRTETLPSMASCYLTWRHLVPGWVACTRCGNPL